MKEIPTLQFWMAHQKTKASNKYFLQIKFMFSKIRGVHSALYLAGLSLMIISLPHSRFSLSVAQFILVGNWLLEGNYRKKITELFTNKPALILVSLFLLHFAGLLWTSDMDYALRDLRIKLPLLALPVIFATTRPPDCKKTDLIIVLYIAAVIVASFISFGILIFGNITDIRQISPFISHIRLSLNICLAIFFSGYFVFNENSYFNRFKPAFVIAMAWLIAFIFLSQSGTGMYVMFITAFVLLVIGLLRIRNSRYKAVIAGSFLVILVSIGSYLFITVRNYLIVDNGKLRHVEMFTANGNPYVHDTVNTFIENGSYIGLYVCENELRQSWNTRSHFGFDGKDTKGHELKATLIRYLNSKGLKKDAAGLTSLSDQDIKNIEQGYANFYYAKKISLNAGIYKLLWEYQTLKHSYNPGGLSVGQRFEYWKAASGIISKYFWTGVGTGDLDNAFKARYIEMNSQLAPEFQHRSHNQFLAIFIAFGVFGFLWFMVTMIYPPLKLRKFHDFRFLVFFIIMVLSMLVEDTLETQQGVTLYAFFTSFLLFVSKERN
jgi:hypothetical protein